MNDDLVDVSSTTSHLTYRVLPATTEKLLHGPSGAEMAQLIRVHDDFHGRLQHLVKQVAEALRDIPGMPTLAMLDRSTP